jgi:hypothetical protein
MDLRQSPSLAPGYPLASLRDACSTIQAPAKYSHPFKSIGDWREARCPNQLNIHPTGPSAGQARGEFVRPALARLKFTIWSPEWTGGRLTPQNEGMALTIPARLATACRSVPERATWLARLPDTLRELEQRWALTLGAPFDCDEVSCAWVAPVTRATGPAAVLKVGMPHMEGEHEIEGLRFWDGDPTVRLLEADDDLGAMLLERCEPGMALRTLSEPEQDLVIARLLRRLWRSPVAPHPFRPLSAMIAHWSDETLAQAERWHDEGLVREGARLQGTAAQCA